MEHVGGFPAHSRLVGQRVLETRALYNRARAAHRRNRRRPARRSAPGCGLLPTLCSGRPHHEATRSTLGQCHDFRSSVYRDAGHQESVIINQRHHDFCLTRRQVFQAVRFSDNDQQIIEFDLRIGGGNQFERFVIALQRHDSKPGIVTFHRRDGLSRRRAFA